MRIHGWFVFVYILTIFSRFNHLGRLLKAMRIGSSSISAPKTLKNMSKIGKKARPAHSNTRALKRIKKIKIKKPKGVDITAIASGASIISDGITIGGAINEYVQGDQEDSDDKSTKKTVQSDEPKQNSGIHVFSRVSFDPVKNSHTFDRNPIFNLPVHDQERFSIKDYDSRDSNFKEIDFGLPTEVISDLSLYSNRTHDGLRTFQQEFGYFDDFEENSESLLSELSKKHLSSVSSHKEGLYEALKVIDYEPLAIELIRHVRDLLFFTEEEVTQIIDDDNKHLVPEDEAETLVKKISSGYVNLIASTDRFIHDQFEMIQKSSKNINSAYRDFVVEELRNIMIFIDNAIIGPDFSSIIYEGESIIKFIKKKVFEIVETNSRIPNMRRENIDWMNEENFGLKSSFLEENKVVLKLLSKVKTKMESLYRSLVQKFKEIENSHKLSLTQTMNEIFENHLKYISNDMKALSTTTFNFLSEMTV